MERENEALRKIQSSQATGVSKGISSGDITAKTSLVSTTTSWITTQDEGKKAVNNACNDCNIISKRSSVRRCSTMPMTSKEVEGAKTVIWPTKMRRLFVVGRRSRSCWLISEKAGEDLGQIMAEGGVVI